MMAVVPVLSGAQEEEVTIGLLIPQWQAESARHGAELAVREATARGGYNGKPYRLVVRSSEGPWGSGSKESVSLVFDDEVVAYMGSLDGRNAHLAEQVATKTKIVFMSAWATDMTLSQAFVPWYFRCIPNDDQQAQALIQEIYRERQLSRVAIIGTGDYDSRLAVRSFIKGIASEKHPMPRHYMIRSPEEDIRKILGEIGEHGSEAIVLFGTPDLARLIVPLLRQQDMNLPVFGTLWIADDQRASDPDWELLEGMILVSPGHWFTSEGIVFQESFREAFGYRPGASAAYAYDATRLIIEVINARGTDRDQVIDGCAVVHYKNGVTGEIRFDGDGNRVGLPGMMTVRDGKPQAVK